MADTGSIVTAGTFVASVLETAGFMVQARFLNDFKDFFREAGAFIYTLAAVGGIFSVCIFGSFRAARYLLLGPALFWFLVGPTTGTRGSVWQLGGGTPRGLGGVVGEDQAIADRNRIIMDAANGWADVFGDSGLRPLSGPINVATGFALFAYPIDSIVRDFTDLLLAQEDREDLLFLSRARGLEVLTTMVPNDRNSGQFIDVFEGNFLRSCHRMIGFATGRASPHLRQRLRDTFGYSPGVVANNPQVVAERNYYQQMFDRYHNENVELTEATRRHIRAQAQARAGAIAGIVGGGAGGGLGAVGPVLAANNSFMPYAAGLALNNGQAPQTLRCGQLWEVVAEMLFHLGRNSQDRVINVAIGDMQNTPENRQIACREIERVIYSRPQGAPQNPGGQELGSGAPCDLASAIALYMLRNQLMRRDTYGRMLQRHWNRDSISNPVAQGHIVPRNVLGEGWQPVIGADGNPVTTNGPYGQLIRYRLVLGNPVGEQQLAPGVHGPPAPTRREQWFPAATHGALQGPNHSTWIATQRYNTVNLRQQIFTWALQIPYWQGMLLFLIATMYPFLTLLVLIPGRAKGFLNVPLAWLWVKSWDVGFAFVMILEKVAYNLLPKTDFPEGLRGHVWGLNQLPDVLSEAMKVDPAYNIHMYYMLVSLALFSVPGITGAMTIKAKKAILSSFTEAALSHARDAGSRASGAYGMGVMNDMVRLRREIQGQAMLGVVSEDANGNLRATSKLTAASANTWGALSALGQGIQAVGAGGNAKKGGLMKALGPEMIRAGESFTSTAGNIQNRELLHDAAYANAFDRERGRWGKVPMIIESSIASMDGGGGFEINDRDTNAHRQLRELFVAKVDTSLDIIQKVISTGIGGFKGAFNKNPAGAAMAIGMLDVMAMGAGVMGGAGEDGRKQIGVHSMRFMRDLMAPGEDEHAFMDKVFHMDRRTYDTWMRRPVGEEVAAAPQAAVVQPAVAAGGAQQAAPGIPGFNALPALNPLGGGFGGGFDALGGGVIPGGIMQGIDIAQGLPSIQPLSGFNFMAAGGGGVPNFLAAGHDSGAAQVVPGAIQSAPMFAAQSGGSLRSGGSTGGASGSGNNTFEPVTLGPSKSTGAFDPVSLGGTGSSSVAMSGASRDFSAYAPAPIRLTETNVPVSQLPAGYESMALNSPQMAAELIDRWNSNRQQQSQLRELRSSVREQSAAELEEGFASRKNSYRRREDDMLSLVLRGRGTRGVRRFDDGNDSGNTSGGGGTSNA